MPPAGDELQKLLFPDDDRLQMEVTQPAQSMGQPNNGIAQTMS
ncbi:MAG: hypothetical protein AAF579_16520 [Cyanobacteria bacterium P01_C01_bin.118]